MELSGTNSPRFFSEYTIGRQLKQETSNPIALICDWLRMVFLLHLKPKTPYMELKVLDMAGPQTGRGSEHSNFSNYLLNQAEKITKLGHWQWDIRNDTIVWSTNLFHIFGVEGRKSMSFEEYLELIHPEDRDYVAGNIQRFLENRQFNEYYHRIITPAGDLKILHARGEVVMDEQDQPIRMSGTSQDVTERKLAEKELIVKAAELEAKNAELEQFAFIASHDLQEPLRKLTVFCSMLENGYKEQFDNKGKELIDKITNCASRMRQLVSDILHLSSLSHGVHYTLVDLNIVVKNVLSDLEAVIYQSEATIHTVPLPLIDGNEVQLTQVFQNLLSNALKFVAPGTRPVIHITAEVIKKFTLQAPTNGTPLMEQYSPIKKEDVCILSIKDNGIGFEESQAEKIFMLFHSVHNKADYQSNGIGLAIVKKIIENHRGHVSAQSFPGEGSVFKVVLPLRQREHGNS